MKHLHWTISDLIDCGQFRRAEKRLQTEPLNGPLGLIYGAEVHLYFERLPEAGALLDRIRPLEITTEVMTRYALVRGQWHEQRGEDRLAGKHFRTAESVCGLLEDEVGRARALYRLGRLKQRQRQWAQAQQLLEQAGALIGERRGETHEYLQALIEIQLGGCAHQGGRCEAAADRYASALTRLGELEGGKHYGLALSEYGQLLMHSGQYETAQSMLRKARRLLSRQGAGQDLGQIIANLALALIRLNRLDEAQRLLREALELARRTGHRAGRAAALVVLAELCLQSDQLARAEAAALEAIDEAESAPDLETAATARIALGRVQLKRQDFYAAAKPLGRALELGRASDSRMIETAAKLYLAECDLPTRPLQAQERLSEVRHALDEHRDDWLAREFERISCKARGKRMRVMPDNHLVIDGSYLPNWHAAKQALESFLLKNALRQTGGNLTKAGQLLGVSKVHVYHMKKKHNL